MWKSVRSGHLPVRVGCGRRFHILLLSLVKTRELRCTVILRNGHERGTETLEHKRPRRNLRGTGAVPRS